MSITLLREYLSLLITESRVKAPKAKYKYPEDDPIARLMSGEPVSEQELASYVNSDNEDVKI